MRLYFIFFLNVKLKDFLSLSLFREFNSFPLSLSFVNLMLFLSLSLVNLMLSRPVDQQNIGAIKKEKTKMYKETFKRKAITRMISWYFEAFRQKMRIQKRKTMKMKSFGRTISPYQSETILEKILWFFSI